MCSGHYGNKFEFCPPLPSPLQNTEKKTRKKSKITASSTQQVILLHRSHPTTEKIPERPLFPHWDMIATSTHSNRLSARKENANLEREDNRVK